MKTILIIIATIVVLLVVVYIYYGGLASVHVQVLNQGGETLVYEEVTGDYKQTGEVSDRVYHALKQDGVETFKGFGIFYDNPKRVEKSKLRSEVGCILEDTSVVQRLSENYKIKVFPRKDYITVESPFKGQLSILVGIFKVYPAMSRFAKEKGYDEESPVMEIYDVPNKKILYRKEILVK